MSAHQITVPEVALVAGTRLALGIGIGLLLAGRMSYESRKAAGWSLAAFGALTTIPLVMEVFGGERSNEYSPEKPLTRVGRSYAAV